LFKAKREKFINGKKEGFLVTRPKLIEVSDVYKSSHIKLKQAIVDHLQNLEVGLNINNAISEDIEYTISDPFDSLNTHYNEMFI
jgi:hypothetical protein